MESRGSNLRSVGMLGATGLVGQRFIQRLQGHPWFRVVAVAASERSAGLPYHQACQWLLPTSIPDSVADLIVQPCCVNSFVGVDIVFSALDSSVAGHVETAFAAAGFAVFTNAANHRMNDQVPILVPFVNPAHLDAVLVQRQHDQTGGFVVANANCSSTGLAVALQYDYQ
jgi:aspartate-semialdehyde dehydrogenase